MTKGMSAFRNLKAWPIYRGRGAVGMAVPCLCVLFAVGTPAQQPDSAPTLTAFEAPGAGTGAGQGTSAFGINAARGRSQGGTLTRAARSTASCAPPAAR